MKVEIPLGDVVDKITILDIKRRKLTRPEALQNVERERAALLAAWSGAGLPDPAELPEWAPLGEVNAALWEVEDDLRAREAQGDFGEAFVEAARSVYKLNDRRAALKRAINERLGSELVEEKSYTDWQAR